LKLNISEGINIQLKNVHNFVIVEGFKNENPLWGGCASPSIHKTGQCVIT